MQREQACRLEELTTFLKERGTTASTTDGEIGPRPSFIGASRVPTATHITV
jgi:hypothetical protein